MKNPLNFMIVLLIILIITVSIFLSLEPKLEQKQVEHVIPKEKIEYQ